MFEKHTSEEYTQPVPGIKQKTLVFGERTLMTEFILTKNSNLPDHAHPYEQTGYLVKGQIVLRIGEKEHNATPGDAWCIPMNIPHSARILEDSIAIEIFSPPRADYLPKGSNRK